MIRQVICILILQMFAVSVFLQAADVDAGKVKSIESIDSKLMKQWNSGQWSDESVDLMKVVWNGIKNAYQQGLTSNENVRIGAIGTPDSQNAAIYIGRFGKIGAGNNVSAGLLEVIQTEDKFSVLLQGRQIPAIVWNHSILFTTGDIVTSPLPVFQGKPHGSMEAFIITAINGKFYFLDFSSFRPIELEKR